MNSQLHIPRRTFLRGIGVTLALPWLEAMSPISARASSASSAPKRAVFCHYGTGMNGRDLTPADTGPNFTSTPILAPMDPLRGDFTLLSNLMLPYGGNHRGDRTFLTGANTIELGSRNTVSVDQQIAATIGGQTRFPSLQLSIARGTGFGQPIMHTISWTADGIPIPAENRPWVVFDQLFRPDSAEEISHREQSFADRASLLDLVRDDAQRVNKRLGRDDREKLDEYFTSVRELEVKLAQAKEWSTKPKPQVTPIDFGDFSKIDPMESAGEGIPQFSYRKYQRLMFDVIALALQTDSTRVVSYVVRRESSGGVFPEMGCPYGYHDMTHHGEDPDKLKWLTKVDTLYMEDWAYFIGKLKSMKEDSGSLLDSSLVAFSSGGGSGNAHNNDKLPTMLCGGSRIGVKHKGHISYDKKPLANLWQGMTELMDVPAPKGFQAGTATGPLTDLT